MCVCVCVCVCVYVLFSFLPPLLWYLVFEFCRQWKAFMIDLFINFLPRFIDGCILIYYQSSINKTVTKSCKIFIFLGVICFVSPAF